MEQKEHMVQLLGLLALLGFPLFEICLCDKSYYPLTSVYC